MTLVTLDVIKSLLALTVFSLLLDSDAISLFLLAGESIPTVKNASHREAKSHPTHGMGCPVWLAPQGKQTSDT